MKKTRVIGKLILVAAALITGLFALAACGGGESTIQPGGGGKKETPREDFVIVDNEIANYIGSGGDIVIPNSVTSIARTAFRNRSDIRSIKIPNSVTSIGDAAFEGCDNLTEITIPFVGAGLNVTSDTHFGYIFVQSGTISTSYYVPASLKKVIITGGNSIRDAAFGNCSRLTSITIPSSVTSIGNYAFADCTGLTSITIPSSVTSIGNYAFAYCRGLTSITIPSSVESIGSCAFYHCGSLTSITIPSSVTRIGSYAFYGWTSSQTIYVQGHSSEPSGWRDWNKGSATVIWNA